MSVIWWSAMWLPMHVAGAGAEGEVNRFGLQPRGAPS